MIGAHTHVLHRNHMRRSEHRKTLRLLDGWGLTHGQRITATVLCLLHGRLHKLAMLQGNASTDVQSRRVLNAPTWQRAVRV